MNKEVKYGNFVADLSRGEQGENEIFSLLHKEFGKENVIDCRRDAAARENDIDAVVIKDGKFFGVEIKTDFTESDNFFAEIVSCAERNSLGNWLKTNAHYIVYYFKKKKKAYIIPTAIGRAEACSGKYRQVEAKDKIDSDGKIIKTSIGALIPILSISRIVNKSLTAEDLFHQFAYDVVGGKEE